MFAQPQRGARQWMCRLGVELRWERRGARGVGRAMRRAVADSADGVIDVVGFTGGLEEGLGGLS